MEFVFETLEPFGVFGDGADVFLKDNLLRGCGTDHFAQPAQVGGTPGGPARITDILPQQEGFQPELGGLEIPDCIFTRPA